MATGDLVTLPVALAWLGTSDLQSVVPGLISAVSTTIQNFVGYQFAQASYTRTFNGNASHKMLLPDRPIVSVTSVTIEGISIPAGTPVPQPGFRFDNKFVYLAGFERYGGFGDERAYAGRFIRGVQNVTISYTAGYATIPPDVVQACLIWLGAVFALSDATTNNPAVNKQRAGDTEQDFGFTVTALDGSVVLMPPGVASYLIPYRRVAT